MKSVTPRGLLTLHAAISFSYQGQRSEVKVKYADFYSMYGTSVDTQVCKTASKSDWYFSSDSQFYYS